MAFRHRMSTLEELIKYQQLKHAGPVECWQRRINAWNLASCRQEFFAGLSAGLLDGLLAGARVEIIHMIFVLLSSRTDVSPGISARIKAARSGKLKEWLDWLIEGFVPCELLPLRCTGNDVRSRRNSAKRRQPAASDPGSERRM